MNIYINYGIDLSKIKLDTNFYKNNYSDLSNLSEEQLIQHYLLHGKKEKRIFCDIQETFDWLKYYIDFKLEKLNENENENKNIQIFNNIYEIWKHFLYNYYKNLHINYKEQLDKNINKINNEIEFDYNYYTNNNSDLSHLDTEQLYLHYHKHGRNEHRIFCNIQKEFNWFYYFLIYDDLSAQNINDLWTHYIYYGIKEIRFINYSTIVDFSLENLNENQQFVYNNKLPYYFINSSSNASNASNVPKSAIIYVFYNRPGEQCNESNLAFFIRQTVLRDKSNIYLFIINGHTCEVVFPQQNNLYVLKNRNCYDFEAYGIGINYLRQKLGQNMNSIQRIVTMNCSVTGPFYKSGHWLSEFENRLNRNNAFCCSTVLYKLEDIRTPGYFNYFKNEPGIINQLLQKVFIRHSTKINCIINGEYGFGKLLLANHKKITFIIDYYNKNLEHGWRGDRDNNLNRYNIYSLIFVKLNWRAVDGINRDSAPVKYNEVIQTMNNICNFNNPLNILHSSNKSINYNLLPINNTGTCYTQSYNWHSKQDFYNKFGKSEEFIIYPISSRSSKLALYAHSDQDNIIKDYCIQAINTLSLLNYEVIILTTSRTFTNVKNLPYKIINIPEAKTDIYMYQKVINKIVHINNYSHLLLCNDTILFPIHGFENMQNSMNRMINSGDYFGIWNSPEIKEHIISSFLHFSKNTFSCLYNYLNSKQLNDFKSAQDLEVNLVTYFNTNKFKYSTVVDYKTLGNIKYQCPIFHPNVFPQWINRKEVFAIKWKYMGNFINKNKINNSYLNYLLKYIHFNHTGPKGKPEQCNCYGNPPIQ